MTVRLRTKLRLASFGVVAIISTLEVIGLYSISQLEDSAHRVARQLRGIDRVQELRHTVERLVMPANDYLIHGGTDESAEFAKLSQALHHCLEAARPELNTVGFDDVTARIEHIEAYASSIFQIVNPIGDPIGSATMERMDTESRALSTKLETILDGARAQVTVELEAATLLEERVWVTMIVGWIGALLLAGAWISLFAGRLARRLVAFQRAVGEVAEHDLDTQIPTDGSDEIGQICAAFNKMTSDLNAVRQALVAAERLSAIGQVTVTVKHEMNNPLQGILSASELLRMAPDDRVLVASTAEKIQDCALRLRDVVERATHISEDRTSEYIGDIKMIRLPDR